jgi:Na+-transporting methylmalonyl-CoA/oxaloacetate decarboxylase gamma subunit
MLGVSDSSFSISLSGQAISRIVGLTCISGFIVDMMALTFPLGSGTAWRVGILQQMGDRSIVLLIGIALLLYSAWENQGLRKNLGAGCMGLGALFLVLCLFIMRESFSLHSQAVNNIGNQASQLQTQVEESRSNPDVAANATPEDFTQALQAIEVQAETLKQNTTTSITRVGLAGASNFAIVGIGLLSLGRMALGPVGRAGGRSAKTTRK